jgi:uncharacterized protein YlxW (UPF0749 family)
MKAEGQVFSSFTALILKVTGIILIVGVLLDYVAAAIPPNFLNSVWLATLISGWVDRGSIPMIGIGILLLGIWVGQVAKQNSTGRETAGGLLIGALILSGLLGVMFLILAPLHFNSSRLASAAQTRSINQEAAKAEATLNNLLAQQRERVNSLVSDDEKYAEFQRQIQSAQLPDDQKAQLKQLQETLRQVRADPKRLDQEVDKARTQGLAQIRERQQQAQDKIMADMRRTRLRVALSSVLMAIGYFAIAGSGLSLSRAKQPRIAKASKKPPKAKKSRAK